MGTLKLDLPLDDDDYLMPSPANDETDHKRRHGPANYIDLIGHQHAEGKFTPKPAPTVHLYYCDITVIVSIMIRARDLYASPYSTSTFTCSNFGCKCQFCFFFFVFRICTYFTKNYA